MCQNAVNLTKNAAFATMHISMWGGGGGRPGQYRGFDDKTHPLPETFSNLPVPRMGRFEFCPACSQVELINYAHEQ